MNNSRYYLLTGAIPEQPHGTPITEVSKFTPCDPKKVVGAYSQSKATATQMVGNTVDVMAIGGDGDVRQTLCYLGHNEVIENICHRLVKLSIHCDFSCHI